jgi:hypothetical protein
MRGIFIFLTLAAAGLFLAGCECMKSKGSVGAFDAAGANEEGLVARYEVLADEILRVEKEEMDIMRALLRNYKAQTDTALTAAKAVQAKDQVKPLETAIEAVQKIALEGDKRIRDTKLKLQKGGHHHTKAEGSEEEYVLVDPKTKAALMDHVGKLRALLAGAQGGTTAPAADLEAIMKDVDTLADKAIAAQRT